MCFEAILTTMSLINRMLFEVLHFQTPVPVFKKSFPHSWLITDILLKVFGCIVSFIFLKITVTNLIPVQKKKKGDFVGYTPTQNGYKCFDLVVHKFFVSMDVTFFESQSLFNDHLQGEVDN